VKLEWRDVAPGDGPAISTSLTLAETDELRRLAKDAYVLEIGSAYGYSAVAMALAGARVLAVDPHRWLNSFGQMWANLVAYNVTSLVEIRATDSQSLLPKLAEENIRFDLVWIDGDHAAAAVAHDVEWARKLLRPGGTLACHDYDEDTCPGVRQALDAWKVPPKLIDTLAIYGPGEW
jgi:predicted O-methyltransferase YrrM